MAYSLMSYLTFGNKITSLIIYNLDDRDHISIICKCLYMVTIAGIYVLVLVPALNIFEDYKSYQNFRYMSETAKRFIVRSMVVTCILFSTLLFPNINILLSLAGAITGTVVSVVLPVMLYNKTYEHNDKKA